MFKKLLIYLVVLLTLYNTGHTQINISVNDVRVKYQQKKIFYTFSKDNVFTSDVLKQNNIYGKWSLLSDKKIKYSFSPECFWLKIPLNGITDKSLNFVSIDNPHINYVKCWVTLNDSILKDFALTGDHLPFSSRQLNSNRFVFPLEGISNNASIVFAFDKRFTKLDIPISFYDSNTFIRSNHIQSILIGFSQGMLVLFLVISMLLFYFTKEKLYLLYSTYILLMALYILVDTGMFFEFLYPNHPEVNDLVRPGINFISIIPLLFFFFELLKFKENFPRLHKLNIWIIIGYLIIFGIAMVNSAVSLNNQGNWLKLGSLLIISIFLVFAIQVFYSVYQRVLNSRLALLSISVIIIFSTIISLEKNDLVPQNLFTVNASFWGIILLSTTMLLAAFLHYKNLILQSERLKEENKIQRFQFLKEISEWEKKQMESISGFMHDIVGANLGLLRLDVDKMNLDELNREILIAHISELSNEVRLIGHSYSPLNFEEKGLYNSIDNIVKRINNHSKISLILQWTNEKVSIDDEFKIIIFRIVQELLNNLLKHSKAQNAFLELMIFENFISIYIEDDGVGFEYIKEKETLGLRSIENIVKTLKGTFLINTGVENGTNISIEFKIK
jgi:signal transduction histidine kinase